MYSRMLHYTLSQNKGNRQTHTHTQDKYSNPRACAPRVKKQWQNSITPIY